MVAAVVPVVVAIIVACVVAVDAIRKPWRTRAHETWTWPLDRADAAIVLKGAVEARRGWTATQVDDERVQVRCRMSWATWQKRIDLALVTVSPRETRIDASCAVPQWFDWGDARRALSYLRSTRPRTPSSAE